VRTIGRLLRRRVPTNDRPPPGGPALLDRLGDEHVYSTRDADSPGSGGFGAAATNGPETERRSAMMRRILALGVSAATLMLSACGDPEQATAEAAAASASPGTTANGLPRTAWGDPDLRGLWPIHHLIGVPFQRPEE